MNRATIVLLAAMFVMGVGFLATAAWAEEKAPAADKPAAEKTEPAPKTTEPKGGKVTDEEISKGLRTYAEEAKKQAEEQKKEDPASDKPPPTAGPYERKMFEVQKVVDEARKLRDKLPEIEAKVNEQVSKLKNGDQPVDTKELQEELARRGGSKNAKTYRELNLALAAYEEAIIAKLRAALVLAHELEKMDPKDDELKTKGDALAASVKEQYIEMLLKVAVVYERVAEKVQVEGSYRRVLAVDKANAAAQNYFKELEKNKGKKEEQGSSGSSRWSSYRR